MAAEHPDHFAHLMTSTGVQEIRFVWSDEAQGYQNADGFELPAGATLDFNGMTLTNSESLVVTHQRVIDENS